MARSAKYGQYLRSSKWRCKRRETLDRDGYLCQACGSGTELDVHHLTYLRFGDEEPNDLLTLCRACHKWAHGQRSATGVHDPHHDLKRLLCGYLRSRQGSLGRYDAPPAGWIKAIRREAERLRVDDEALGLMMVDAASSLGLPSAVVAR